MRPTLSPAAVVGKCGQHTRSNEDWPASSLALSVVYPYALEEGKRTPQPAVDLLCWTFYLQPDEQDSLDLKVSRGVRVDPLIEDFGKLNKGKVFQAWQGISALVEARSNSPSHS